jgi:hypothetical protein
MLTAVKTSNHKNCLLTMTVLRVCVCVCIYIYTHTHTHTHIQGVSKIHGINSGMSSSHVDKQNSLYQHRSVNA